MQVKVFNTYRTVNTLACSEEKKRRENNLENYERTMLKDIKCTPQINLHVEFTRMNDLEFINPFIKSTIILHLSKKRFVGIFKYGNNNKLKIKMKDYCIIKT